MTSELPMTATWQHYHTPATVEEALRLMARYGEEARLIAGGTDLILDLRDRDEYALTALVDVTQIRGLNTIEEQRDAEGDWIVLGAAVTHTQIERSALLQAHAPALVESCRVVGGPQVRNVATLGGNVAHALPAADGAIGLLALDAQVEVGTLDATATETSSETRPQGTQVAAQEETVQREWRPLLDIYDGPGRNNLTANQMLTAFRFRRAEPGTTSAFDRIMRPQGVALPILGVAARATLDAENRVAHAIIAVGPAGPIPFRAREAEAALHGVDAGDTTGRAAAIEAAVAAAQTEAQLRTSAHRASKEYRHEMLAVLLRRVLKRVLGNGEG
jgi:CO/xanthine dehydrogenase FAD-binding subunit